MNVWGDECQTIFPDSSHFNIKYRCRNSLKAPLLWAPLCGANNNGPHVVLLWFIADIQFGIGSDFLRTGRKKVLQEVLAKLKISPWREQCINCGHGLDQYLFDSDGGGVRGNCRGKLNCSNKMSKRSLQTFSCRQDWLTQSVCPEMQKRCLQWKKGRKWKKGEKNETWKYYASKLLKSNSHIQSLDSRQ